MNPRRTHESNHCFGLVGGNEDNTLWVKVDRYAGGDSAESRDAYGDVEVASVWEPDERERALIANGANVRLVVWGGQPPVRMGVTTVPLGKAPTETP